LNGTLEIDNVLIGATTRSFPDSPKEPLLRQRENLRRLREMTGSKLYVGNISYDATGEDLKGLFSAFGTVTEAVVIERKGFGFVTMGTSEEADKAKTELNGKDFQGRTIKVDEARPPREKGSRGGFGGRGRNRY
jgi:RNA recognition motif-containing protein